MFISIVIPIWNDEKYLTECLDSCLKQGLPLEEYELICVDDGSTDRTPEILRSYADQYPNIRLLMMERHKGGRTVGYLQAKGEYIWFVDHDDLIAPNALAELKSFALAHPEADCISFPYYHFFESFTEAERELFNTCQLKDNDRNRRHNAVVWDSIFKHSFLVDHNLFPFPKVVLEAKKYWGLEKFPVFGSDSIFMAECNDCNMRRAYRDGNALYCYRYSSTSQTADNAKPTAELRSKKNYNSLLCFIYMAIRAREKYELERQQNGAATTETTINLIVKLRGIAKMMAFNDPQFYRPAIKILREKQAFFTRKPPEYSFGLSDYLKMRGGSARFSPFAVAEYYSFTLKALIVMRRVKTFWRLRSKVSAWRVARVAISKKLHQRR
ncbi:MAG: glycosyltransferase family 2 protein [Oscillospiraceae bacterium]|nr:glycosyltransferase family 2 protein [Oscillospiraceae bacterium]